MRFRRSIKLAPGMRMNLSGSGASWTLGPRGASIGIGKRGTFLNTGIPGSGLSFRQSLISGARGAAAAPQTTTAQKVSLTVEVAHDGTVSFTDLSGNPASEALVDAAKAQKSDAIRSLIQQACDRINDQIDAVSQLHLFVPDPRTPPHFQQQFFHHPRPEPPKPRRLGFFAKLFRSNVARVEVEHRQATTAYEIAVNEWEVAKQKFDASEEERRQLFFRVQSGDQDAVESFFGNVVWICLKVRRCFRDFVASIPSQVASFSA